MPPAATRGQTVPTQSPHPKAGAGGTDPGEPLPPRAAPELAQKDGTTGTSLLYRDTAACSVQASPTLSRHTLRTTQSARPPSRRMQR